MFSLCFSDTLMLEPMILPDCGHTFCKTCISRVQQNPTTSHCPLCKKPIWSSTQLKTNFTLKKLVEKIEVKCTACNERGSIEVVARHTCPDALISCSNRGCQRSIKRKDEPTHEKECLYAVISCEQCHQNTTVANKELHLKKTCPRGEIRCPLKCRKRPRRSLCGLKALYIIISNWTRNSLDVCKRKHFEGDGVTQQEASRKVRVTADREEWKALRLIS